MTQPSVYVYECLAPPADALRFAARLRVEMVTKKQKVVMDWLPVSFYGATAEEAREKARKHWDDAIAAERAKTANIAAGVEKRRQSRIQQPDLEAIAEQAVGLGDQP